MPAIAERAQRLDLSNPLPAVVNNSSAVGTAINIITGNIIPNVRDAARELGAARLSASYRKQRLTQDIRTEAETIVLRAQIHAAYKWDLAQREERQRAGEVYVPLFSSDIRLDDKLDNPTEEELVRTMVVGYENEQTLLNKREKGRTLRERVYRLVDGKTFTPEVNAGMELSSPGLSRISSLNQAGFSLGDSEMYELKKTEEEVHEARVYAEQVLSTNADSSSSMRRTRREALMEQFVERAGAEKVNQLVAAEAEAFLAEHHADIKAKISANRGDELKTLKDGAIQGGLYAAGWFAVPWLALAAASKSRVLGNLVNTIAGYTGWAPSVPDVAGLVIPFLNVGVRPLFIATAFASLGVKTGMKWITDKVQEGVLDIKDKLLPDEVKQQLVSHHFATQA